MVDKARWYFEIGALQLPRGLCCVPCHAHACRRAALQTHGSSVFETMSDRVANVLGSLGQSWKYVLSLLVNACFHNQAGSLPPRWARLIAMGKVAGHDAPWRFTQWREDDRAGHPPHFEPRDSRLQESQIVVAGAERHVVGTNSGGSSALSYHRAARAYKIGQ
jgi:hypothetical protein